MRVRVINEAGREISLGQRADLVAAIGTGVFLSIHHDSVQPVYLSQWTVDGRGQRYSDIFRGFSLFVSFRGADPDASRDLAGRIGESMRSAGFRPSLHHGEAIKGENRPILDATNGIYRFDGLAVLRAALGPALLIEVGIIVNRDEELALESSEHRSRAIAAIIAGLNAFC
jgi:N-acetylmuramoyl-L-alanine amidase